MFAQIQTIVHKQCIYIYIYILSACVNVCIECSWTLIYVIVINSDQFKLWIILGVLRSDSLLNWLSKCWKTREFLWYWQFFLFPQKYIYTSNKLSLPKSIDSTLFPKFSPKKPIYRLIRSAEVISDLFSGFCMNY